jgi:hypothetical protein
VAEWRASGLTAARFAEGRGYAPMTLTWWAWKLGRPSGGEAARGRAGRAPAPKGEGETEGAFAFARVVLAAPTAPPPDDTPVTIERGALRVHVGRGFDASVLADVLAVLDARGGGARDSGGRGDLRGDAEHRPAVELRPTRRTGQGRVRQTSEASYNRLSSPGSVTLRDNPWIGVDVGSIPT